MKDVASPAKLKKPVEAYRGDAPYVFVSYSHRDKEAVYIELVRLKKLGFNVWYDDGIGPGTRWSDELAERIANCALFLYFVTRRSAKSRNCQDEAIYVLDAGNPFLAVHLEETDLPPGLQLRMGPQQAILRFDLDSHTYQDRLYDAILSKAPELGQGELNLRQGFAFAGYKVEPRRGSVTRPDGTAHHVEPKVMNVFVCLAEHAGQPVSRELLLDTVWPEQVAADELLTRAISELRRALHDGGDNSKYIETIPKRGYSLVAEIQAQQRDSGYADRRVFWRPSQRFGSILSRVLLGIFLIVVTYAVIDSGVIDRAGFKQPGDSVSGIPPAVPRAPIRSDLRPRAVTSMEGFENQPALSPDGSYVAFTVGPDSAGLTQTDIYVNDINTGGFEQMTNTSDHESFPTWSPDGTRIAFIRSSRVHLGWDREILTKAIIGGLETRIASVNNALGLDWAPDGNSLAYSSRETPEHNFRIFLLSLETGDVRQLSRPDESPDEQFPKFSPDGRSLAFVRVTSVASAAQGVPAGRQLCIEDLSDEQSRCVTPVDEEWQIWGHDWAPDSQSLVVALGGRSGGRFLLRVPAYDGNPVLLPYGMDAKFVSIARQGSRLVFSREFRDTNLWRVPGPASTEVTDAEKLSGSSTWDELFPAYSPDGTKLAYVSARSSFWELWVAQADGSDPRQLTRMGNAAWPQWSPDSQRIVFGSTGYPAGIEDLVAVHIRPNKLQIYAIDAAGGIPEPLTDIEDESKNPSFSLDGRSIFFAGSFISGCGGPVWRQAVDSGQRERLVDCAFRPLGGPGGRVYFFYGPDGGIRSMPADGGELRMEVSESVRGCVLPIWGWNFWRSNLVYMDCQNAKITMLDLETRETRELTTALAQEIDVYEFALDVSPDGEWIVYTQVDRGGSDLMLIEPFN